MMHRLIPLLALLPLPAAAQSPIAEVLCAQRSELVQKLTVQFGARLAGTGLRNAEMVMEVWTDPRGDWTMVQSYTDGRACIVAMGEGWEAVEPPDPA